MRNTMKNLTETEKDFIIGCRELDLFCYQLHMKYKQSQFVDKIVKHSECLINEGINPLYDEVDAFRSMWYKYTQNYLSNIRYAMQLICDLGFITQREMNENVGLCDRLIKQSNQIHQDNMTNLALFDTRPTQSFERIKHRPDYIENQACAL